MVTYISRAQIGLVAPTGSTQLVPSQVKNTAFHYPGMASPINAVGDAGFRRVCSALRGWQTYHMKTRGWSDIAYCVAIDQVGRKYTLRGINIRSAANGGTQVNLEYGAVLLVLGNNEAPSAAMEKAAREVMGDYRIRYSRIPRRPTWHGAIRPGGTADDPSTTCPGKLTIAEIKAGKFDAASTPVVPPATKPPATPSGGLSMADAASLEKQIQYLSAVLLGRYQRAEDVAAAQAKLTTSVGTAVATLAKQIQAEDAADDAALQALIKSVNDNVDALEAVIQAPQEGPPAPLA